MNNSRESEIQNIDTPLATRNFALVNEREEFNKIVTNVVSRLGAKKALEKSIERNVKEAASTLGNVIEEVRNDLQILYISLINDLTQTVREDHLDFLSDIQENITELISETHHLRGKVIAQAELRAERVKLDEEERERQENIRKHIEQATNDLIGIVSKVKTSSDPSRAELENKIKSIMQENAKLKSITSRAYRCSQDIKFWRLSKSKDRLMDILGEALDV